MLELLSSFFPHSSSSTKFSKNSADHLLVHLLVHQPISPPPNVGTSVVVLLALLVIQLGPLWSSRSECKSSSWERSSFTNSGWKTEADSRQYLFFHGKRGMSGSTLLFINFPLLLRMLVSVSSSSFLSLSSTPSSPKTWALLELAKFGCVLPDWKFAFSGGFQPPRQSKTDWGFTKIRLSYIGFSESAKDFNTRLTVELQPRTWEVVPKLLQHPLHWTSDKGRMIKSTSMHLMIFLGIFFSKCQMFSSASFKVMIIVTTKQKFGQNCQICSFKLAFGVVFFTQKLMIIRARPTTFFGLLDPLNIFKCSGRLLHHL